LPDLIKGAAEAGGESGDQSLTVKTLGEALRHLARGELACLYFIRVRDEARILPQQAALGVS
jgi:hypothetical protein